MDMRIMLSMMRELGELRQRDRWSRPQIEAYQAGALNDLRAFAYKHSAFYREFHQGLTDRPLSQLPVLTKATLMEHFDDLVTDPAIRLAGVREYTATPVEKPPFLGRYWVNATSGSTGHPGLFVFNRSEWTAVLASFARAHEWAGLGISLTHRMKMASVASTTPWHMSAQVGATLRSWWMPALRLAASQPLEEIVQQLNEWQPEMLIAYASMSGILADEQIAGRLRISPHLVFTSSEVLTDDTRRRVDAAWGHPPFDQYAATETGGLAAECAQGNRLHLFEDSVIVEAVDEHNRPVPSGSFGAKLLVTVLFNRTQPLIRYELSDSVLISGETCVCGRPFAIVGGIQGRIEDVLRLPGAHGGEVNVHPVTFHRIMDAVRVSGWQVVQKQEAIEVLLSGAPGGFDEGSLAESFHAALSALDVVVPTIRVMRVSTIPKSQAGKTRLVKCELVRHAVAPALEPEARR